MFITLLTGAIGSGKTLLAISKVNEWFPGRPVYTNITGCVVPGWKIQEDFERWYELEENAVIVVDECQDHFPVRDGKTPVPEKCKRFERTRKRGHNVVLITQRPRQMDIHVRELVTKHYHLQRNFGLESSAVLEWERLGDPDDETSKGVALKWMFGFPKENYQLYKSAALHTSRRRIPKKLYLIPVALVVVVGCVWWLLHSLQGIRASPVPGKSAGVAGTVRPAGAGSSKAGPVSRVEYVEARLPRIPDVPHSAPVYDALATPVYIPLVAACVSSRESGCKCYTQQATIIVVSDAYCRHFVAFGAFVPFSESVQGPARHEAVTDRGRDRRRKQDDELPPGGAVVLDDMVTGTLKLSPPKPAVPDGGGPSTNPRINPAVRPG